MTRKPAARKALPRPSQANGARRSPVVSLSLRPEERVALDALVVARGLPASRAVGAVLLEEQRRAERRGK